MRKRPKVPRAIEAEILTACRRRCCLCVALRADDGEKKGQIAHLDHDPSNNAPDNLVFLCLEHHDEYDSTSSQSKGLTIEELKRHRAALTARMAAGASGLRDSSLPSGPQHVTAAVYLGGPGAIQISGPNAVNLRGPGAITIVGPIVQSREQPLQPQPSDDEIAARLVVALDRPAFRTPFHGESSLPRFRDAIAEAIDTLNTGRSPQGVGPGKHQIRDERLRSKIDALVGKLVALRATFDELLRRGVIRPCGCGSADCPTYMLSAEAAREMDSKRRVLLDLAHELNPRLPRSFYEG